MGVAKKTPKVACPLALVIPCYNEAKRLDASAWQAFVDLDPSIRLVFVDDGSTDETLAKLNEIATSMAGRAETLAQTQNSGKGEAVRAGLRHALATGHEVVGYADADLATPASELVRLANLMVGSDLDVLIGARVALLGRKVKRHSYRHYLGRAFATSASLMLGLPVYDTQCGAKFFRRSEALLQALSEPFSSRWSFDVELLGRLLHTRAGVAPIPVARIREEPLNEWIDVPGSKLNVVSALRSGVELARIGWRLRRRA